jgi:ADP-dependent NAD(P)H-hydrate dehydratase / NAD(P)H-hydrate epimerase
MRPIVSTAEMAALERRADEGGLSVSLLMEEAGRGLAQAALKQAASGGRFAVFCGSGNNGGDGYVAARYLYQWGHQVEVVAAAPSKTEEARRNVRALHFVGVRPSLKLRSVLGRGDVVLDCLLGTGLRDAPRADIAKVIRTVNALRGRGARVVSADVPSGVASDRALSFNPAVVADVTVAFGFYKKVHWSGILTTLGRVELAPLGIPDGLALAAAKAFVVEEHDAVAQLKPRAASSHKGTYGHVLIVAGQPGQAGAAALSARAAVRSGAGLVTVVSSRSVLDVVTAQVPEAMGVAVEGDAINFASLLQNKSTVLIGPGLGTSQRAAHWLEELLAVARVPCVVDADGINLLALHPAVLQRRKAPLILTPHPGEMARLLGERSSVVQHHRFELASSFAVSKKLTVVLKGAHTLTATAKGQVFVNPTGNPGMATGGSGDVLAGMIAALVAQTSAVEEAAWVGAFAHGKAGDVAAQQHGALGLCASDIVNALGTVWSKWRR